MITRILSSEDGIIKGAKLINEGKVVAFPTETVYGLGANALNEQAVIRIFEAKGRPSDNPLIVHIADIDDIYKIADNISEDALTLAKIFMPGPLTLVLKKKDIIPTSVTAGLNTVAIRMPDHQIAREFIRACGVPLAAPSANISTFISPTSANHVMQDLQGRIELIIDGGNCRVGIESTVIDMTVDEYTILRPGFITRDMIEEVLGKKIGEKYITINAPASPGMKYRHYSPKKPLSIMDDPKDVILLYDKLDSEDINTVIITRNKINYSNRNTIDIGSSTVEIARNIYSALREAESQYDYIISENFEDDSLGHSVMNRLNKAAKKS